MEPERVKLDIDAGDTRKPEFRAVNPNGRVPVIVHEGIAIWESAAIAIYLGEMFGVAEGLFPAPGPKRGEAMKWIVWTNATLAEAAGRLSASLPTGNDGAVQAGSVDYVPPEDRSHEALAKATAGIESNFAILNAALARRDFLIGEYSLADTHLWGIVGWIGGMGVDIAPFKDLSGWVERCNARPALRSMMDV